MQNAKFNLQNAISKFLFCKIHFTKCNLHNAIFKLKSANCNLQNTICKMLFIKIRIKCNLQKQTAKYNLYDQQNEIC